MENKLFVNSNSLSDEALNLLGKIRNRRIFFISFSQMTARDNINAQLEHLQSKYVGTGHADTNK